ncbi:MAG: hypothetical protein HYW79_00070 [Parcubacteria group bacterium]|nr:hypothetical protein [Parcubacteria group bacterium]
MTELQKTNALLRELLQLIYVQHQFFMWALSPDHYGAWLNRMTLAYRLQKHHVWTEEEWSILVKKDFKDGCKRWPQMKETWKKLRKYYSRDVVRFMDELFVSMDTPQKKSRKRK